MGRRSQVAPGSFYFAGDCHGDFRGDSVYGMRFAPALRLEGDATDRISLRSIFLAACLGKYFTGVHFTGAQFTGCPQLDCRQPPRLAGSRAS